MDDDLNPYASPPALSPEPAQTLPPEPLPPNVWTAADLPSAAQLMAFSGGLGFLVGSSVASVALFLGGSPGVEAPMGLLIMAQGALAIAGAIAIHRRRRRWLALAGAWGLLLPALGCSCVSVVAGFWCLGLLSQPSVRAEFKP